MRGNKNKQNDRIVPKEPDSADPYIDWICMWLHPLPLPENEQHSSCRMDKLPAGIFQCLTWAEIAHFRLIFYISTFIH